MQVQGIGEQDTAAIEAWLFEERERIKGKKNRLLQTRADILSEHFYDAFKRRVPNPPAEAQEELKRLDGELAKCEVELREAEAEADRRRNAPLDVDGLAEAARAELEELEERRRVYCHRVYIMRYTPYLQDLENVERRIAETENLIERYELAASARDELQAREKEGA